MSAELGISRERGGREKVVVGERKENLTVHPFKGVIRKKRPYNVMWS